jgi:2-oxoglutarate dehydrogenase E2 component (dihydrolipoamide succinyltransferase)
MVEVKVPSVGESISEVQISQWLKKEGDYVESGMDLVELETEKASVQIPAPVSGILSKIVKLKDEFATVGDILCVLEPAEKSLAQETVSPQKPADIRPVAADQATRVMPAAARALADHQLSPEQVPATGPGGRLLKEDVVRFVETKNPVTASSTVPKQTPVLEISQNPSEDIGKPTGNRIEEVKPMSMIRRTIATRLVQAQHTAALLTTFNEVDMQPVMGLRTKYRDAFQEKHGVKLGFMSFFAKAACEGLKRFPLVNAELRGNNIVLRHYCDIGIAIGGGKGLVVPILRNVEKMGFAEIERSIGDFSRKAMENRLVPGDLEGGTFTISNGGVYGSLLSTPIVNPPQSGILGLHSIQDRPVAVNGEVVIRPMMYLALTYDHRIVDGREAVTFLKTIKEVIEDPTRLFLEV